LLTNTLDCSIFVAHRTSRAFEGVQGASSPAIRCLANALTSNRAPLHPRIRSDFHTQPTSRFYSHSSPLIDFSILKLTFFIPDLNNEKFRIDIPLVTGSVIAMLT
jgi:hypothetical protein